MNILSIFHRFLFSVVVAAPFYNLMNKSEHKLYIIAGILIVLNIIFNLIGNRARKSLLLKPVTIAERKELFKKFRSNRKSINYTSAGETEEKRLAELKSLYDKNLITAEEYRDKKKEIIDGI